MRTFLEEWTMAADHGWLFAEQDDEERLIIN